MKSIIIILFCTFSFGQNSSSEIYKIMKTGDGQSIKTAYKVNSVDEEYDVLRYLKLKPIMQKLYMKDGNFYDAITTKSKTIYFKIVTKKISNKNLPQVI